MLYRHRQTDVVVEVRDGKVMGGVWEPVEAGSPPPPKAGRGSSRQAWADHASTVGVEVSEDMSRDDIIAAVEGE
jgi:hypothetical protein